MMQTGRRSLLHLLLLDEIAQIRVLSSLRSQKIRVWLARQVRVGGCRVLRALHAAHLGLKSVQLGAEGVQRPASREQELLINTLESAIIFAPLRLLYIVLLLPIHFL